MYRSIKRSVVIKKYRQVGYKGINMIYDTKLPQHEREQLQGMMNKREPNKLVNPKEKIGEKIPKDFYARSPQK